MTLKSYTITIESNPLSKLIYLLYPRVGFCIHTHPELLPAFLILLVDGYKYDLENADFTHEVPSSSNEVNEQKD